MLVLPLRHPVVVAKLVATIDALSRGRVVLGVGSGWLPDELALVDTYVALGVAELGIRLPRGTPAAAFDALGAVGDRLGLGRAGSTG